MEKKSITPNIGTFEDLILGKYIYVDKTEYLWNLVKEYKGTFFLSRPRRFGKSLTVSTLKAIFEGKKDLFKGLAIYEKDYEWKKYPVIHLSFGNCMARNDKDLEIYLRDQLLRAARTYQLPLRGSSLTVEFQSLIEDIAGHDPAVILVDEYDKPLLNVLGSREAPAMLDVLKGFYSSIKEANAHIRFTFITGVSKFCHVSLFSGFNTPADLSMKPAYATMLGYTQEELESNFKAWLDEAEAKQSLPHDAFMAQIKEWYDGFRFAGNAETVYNPVSVANFLVDAGMFFNYWYATGTPSFLPKLIREKNINPSTLFEESVGDEIFSSMEIDNLSTLGLMLQTGYATIKNTIPTEDGPTYELGFPNKEVGQAFCRDLLSDMAGKDSSEVQGFIRKLASAVRAADLDSIHLVLEVFFAHCSYALSHKQESNFQNVIWTVFFLLGYSCQAEIQTGDGRIDTVVLTRTDIFLFEFKLNGDPSALDQIRRKEYFKRYLLDGKKIHLIGVNFSTDKGNIVDWKTEEVPNSRELR